MKQSSGTLLYRRTQAGLEVLLVHPSGNYNRKKPWSIPKGMPDAGETLEEAARRETLEETGIEAGPLTLIGTVRYTKSGKLVHAFAGPWTGGQPSCTSWEVDCAEFVLVDEARRLLHPDQRQFLDSLAELLDGLGD